MAKIKEDYVSYETAKLLKKSGFDCDEISCINVFKGHTYKVHDTVVDADEDVTIPTIQMAMKWLREIHNLHIDIFVTYKDGIPHYQWSVDNLKTQDTISETPCCIAYEQACEAAIRYSLKNLI